MTFTITRTSIKTVSPRVVHNNSYLFQDIHQDNLPKRGRQLSPPRQLPLHTSFKRYFAKCFLFFWGVGMLWLWRKTRYWMFSTRAVHCLSPLGCRSCMSCSRRWMERHKEGLDLRRSCTALERTMYKCTSRCWRLYIDMCDIYIYIYIYIDIMI